MNKTIPKLPKMLEEDEDGFRCACTVFVATMTKVSAKDEAVGSPYSPVAE